MIFKLTKREYNALYKIAKRREGTTIWVQNGWLMVTDSHVLALYEAADDKVSEDADGLMYYDLADFKALGKDVMITVDAMEQKYLFVSGAARCEAIGRGVTPNASPVIRDFLRALENPPANGNTLHNGFDPTLSRDWFAAARADKHAPFSLRTLDGNFIFGYYTENGWRYLLQMARRDDDIEENVKVLKEAFCETNEGTADQDLDVAASA